MDATLVAKIAARGVLVAGGLHPAIRPQHFRVGHMARPDILERTVVAVAGALREAGVAVDAGAAVGALAG